MFFCGFFGIGDFFFVTGVLLHEENQQNYYTPHGGLEKIVFPKQPNVPEKEGKYIKKCLMDPGQLFGTNVTTNYLQ